MQEVNSVGKFIETCEHASPLLQNPKENGKKIVGFRELA